jgi:hypothetical protein
MGRSTFHLAALGEGFGEQAIWHFEGRWHKAVSHRLFGNREEKWEIGAQEEFQKLVDRMRKIPNIKELVSSDISPALGVHTGPGLLGVCFHEV